MPTKKSSLYEDIPDQIEQEIFQDLLNQESFRVERILSRGHTTPEGEWYDQERDEWVVLLKGKAGLLFEENQQLLVMEPGDYVLIPAHQRHRVEWTSREETTVWLAVHYRTASATKAVR